MSQSLKNFNYHCLAPAKLNLFLHIIGQRADGYHLLQTVFQFIDLADELFFSLTDTPQISVDNPIEGLAMEQDLVYRAADLLRQHTGCQHGIHIKVEKKIPTGGGLGGGSSDAATTLLMLNQLWNLKLSNQTLVQLGLRLGADVPVFINGHAVWAEGIGEIQTPIDLAEPWYLLIHPDCHVNTKEVFLKKDLTRGTKSITIRAFLAGHVSNDCQNVVCQDYPAVDSALNWLNQFSDAKLTGTGACLFAQFANWQAANDVKQQVPQKWTAWVTRGMNKSPALDCCWDIAKR